MNEIVITRAPRLNPKPWEEIKNGTYYLMYDIEVDGKRGCKVSLKHNLQGFVLSERILLDYDLPKTGSLCFRDFHHVCKWVSNGRRLEDLQSDASLEYVPALELEKGQFATVASSPYDDYPVGSVIHKLQYGIASITSEHYLGDAATHFHEIVVWPLGPGDSITITTKP